MVKLVVLSESQKGLSHELKGEKITIGRVEDNTFQIPEQSVSSHHCEILLRGPEVVVKDLNSTNGTYINGEQIVEKVLKPGQTLRLGSIDLRLDDGTTPAPVEKPAARSSSRTQGGVKFSDTAPISPVFDKNSPFAKKSNKVGIIFIAVAVTLLILIVILVGLALSQMRS